MRGAPQSKFSALIRRIKARKSPYWLYAIRLALRLMTVTRLPAITRLIAKNIYCTIYSICDRMAPG